MTIEIVSSEEAIRMGFGEPSMIVSPRLRNSSLPSPEKETDSSENLQKTQEKKEQPTNKK